MNYLKSESVDRLIHVLQSLQSEEEYYQFFEDVCTIKEIKDIAQRLDTAMLLDAGESYQDISQKIGVSSATIGRVNRCLNYGTGGYRMVLDRLKAKEGTK